MLQQFIWDAIWTRSSSGTGVINLGSQGSGVGSGPGFRNFMQVIGILARIGTWSASPDVFRTSVWAAMPVHMDSGTSYHWADILPIRSSSHFQVVYLQSLQVHVFLGWWLLESCQASRTDCISRLESEPPVWCSLVVAAFLDCLCPFPVAWISGLSECPLGPGRCACYMRLQ
ncbi:hypothetical protein WJX77_009863 [Trebouxia sp. C0004]